MFLYSTYDVDIISDYNDYLFLKFNYDDYFEDLSLLVIETCCDPFLLEEYKDATSSFFKTYVINEMLGTLNNEQIQIIESHFNPVILERLKKIFDKKWKLINMNNYHNFPIFSHLFFKEFKKLIYNKIKIDKFMNSD